MKAALIAMAAVTCLLSVFIPYCCCIVSERCSREEEKNSYTAKQS